MRMDMPLAPVRKGTAVRNHIHTPVAADTPDSHRTQPALDLAVRTQLPAAASEPASTPADDPADDPANTLADDPADELANTPADDPADGPADDPEVACLGEPHSAAAPEELLRAAALARVLGRASAPGRALAPGREPVPHWPLPDSAEAHLAAAWRLPAGQQSPPARWTWRDRGAAAAACRPARP
eukprot:scaffold358_cov256-Pinguiococcus_pyrenoidosus.AAC.19